MGLVTSLLSDKNLFYYVIIAYAILTVFCTEPPKKSADVVPLIHKPRLVNRKKWIENEMQILHEELTLISKELEEPVIPSNLQALIHSEVNRQIAERGRNE